MFIKVYYTLGKIMASTDLMSWKQTRSCMPSRWRGAVGALDANWERPREYILGSPENPLQHPCLRSHPGDVGRVECRAPGKEVCRCVSAFRRRVSPKMAYFESFRYAHFLWDVTVAIFQAHSDMQFYSGIIHSIKT